MNDALWTALLFLVLVGTTFAQHESESDVLSTSAGDLTMTFIGRSARER